MSGFSANLAALHCRHHIFNRLIRNLDNALLGCNVDFPDVLNGKPCAVCDGSDDVVCVRLL